MDANLDQALSERDRRRIIFSGMRTEELRVSYSGSEILKGITLDAHRGEILSIIGPAGAGKTTFLRCLNRMLDLDPDWRISGTMSAERSVRSTARMCRSRPCAARSGWCFRFRSLCR